MDASNDGCRGPVTDATSEQLRFKEIEHKFVVDDGFDLDRFGTLLEALNPTRTTSLRVRDTYYFLHGSGIRRFVIRHRFDEELHHLTVKTLEADTEVRQEVNIDLGHHAGDQRAQVDAFLEQLGVEWSGTLQKGPQGVVLPRCRSGPLSRHDRVAGGALRGVRGDAKALGARGTGDGAPI